ncbi:Rpn family recombination-promoting nuclease/putative transposase [Dyadobacter frigoris]|uniref:Rpn family recombination-promoting nuclease/putative transposase n=1 Tax=Dyadobacter frigoris TaxID=2576211 RepID=A0A4U6D6F3_9BACT|nr:Rpn family recombination-promoting nuclease/putative transposase [Dyadobacter frigoris]TKT91807.1 Rpn family recombination-promoting nuclease/putative transposase [Dyadobacter frigoris]
MLPTGRFIDPFTDFGFKRLFGSEPNKDLLIDFLNQVMGEDRQIVDLTYNPTEHFGHSAENRKTIFDLLCTGSNGEQFIIEMQRVRQEYFKDRSLYYTSSLITQQAPKGGPQWNYHLKPVYLIGIMDFSFDDTHSEQYLHRIQLMKTDTLEVFYDKLGFVFIEIPKFLKNENELTSELDNWLFLLKNMSRLDKIPVFLRKPVFSKLFNIAEVSNLTGKEKMAYDQSLKIKWDNYSTMSYAIKEGKAEGKKEGLKEGLKEGKAEGLKEGKVEGFKEGKVENQKEIALAMKNKGMEISLIQELTGLSEKEIEKL